MPSPTYIDGKGYRRFRDSDKLVHRWVAYNKVYLKDKDSYPMGFGNYQIHHKDGNKLNNRPSNLQILTEQEHRDIHGIDRSILLFKVFVFIILGGIISTLFIAVGINEDNAMTLGLIGAIIILTWYYLKKEN